jgi:hypothetical protein
MYGSPIYGADVSGSLTDQDVDVSIFLKFLVKLLSLLITRGRSYCQGKHSFWSGEGGRE